MLRGIGSIVAALVTWTVVVTVLNVGLRYGFPGYAAVEQAMTFTVPMMIARLSISFVSTLFAGRVSAWIARSRFTAPLITGIVLLAIFIPIHISIWSHFPIWYHLTFLPSLPILSIAGGRLARVTA